MPESGAAANRGSPPPTGRGRLRGWVGVAVILGCLLLPIVLGVLATTSEQAEADRAIGEIEAAATASPSAAAGASTPARPRLLDQHYYFVNGCVSAPLDCGTADSNTWGEYYSELGRLYDEAAASVAGGEQEPSFEEWAATHVHFVSAQTAAEGASELEQILPQNSTQADFHMVGTSAGGASIFSYLGRAMRGEVALDRRLRSAIAVDSPLGFQFPFRSTDLFLGIQSGAMKSDVQPGLGEWAKAANISLFTVNTQNDIVNHENVPNVPDDPLPIYPQESTPPAPADLDCRTVVCMPVDVAQTLILGSNWHIYTGSHMAVSTRQFMDEHWR